MDPVTLLISKRFASERAYGAAKAALEAASGGHCTILRTNKGQWSYVRRLARFNVEDVAADLGIGTHEAFIIGGVAVPEVWVGMFAGRLVNGELLSLPGVDPTVSRNFDLFSADARACGAGWHLMTNAEWMAISLLALKSGQAERGNTSYGRSYNHQFEVGRRQDGNAPGTNAGNDRTLTGSGPASWWQPNVAGFGWADLVGNVWEWVGGVRSLSGEPNVIPDNDAATADMSAGSAAWRAIAQDGTLVAPGTSGTLHYDGRDPAPAGTARINSEVVNAGDVNSNVSQQLSSLTAAAGVSVPAVARRLGLAPSSLTTPLGRLYSSTTGERLGLRGGYWYYSSYAGLAALNLYGSRGDSSAGLGGRPAFVF